MSIRNRRKALPTRVLLFCVCFLGTSCVFFQQSNSAEMTPPGDSVANSMPISERTLIPSNSAVSPPANLVEMLRTEMRAAAPALASERHPASKLVGQSCEEVSFAYLETEGNQTQYIGLYRCPMKGAILGSTYDSQVDVTGAITAENGSYARRIVSAKALN